MKINWFKIKIIKDPLFSSMAQVIQRGLLFQMRVFLKYIKYGNLNFCKDCGEFIMICNCDFCKKCRDNLCMCNFKYSDEMETFIKNWIEKNLSKYNISKFDEYLTNYHL